MWPHRQTCSLGSMEGLEGPAVAEGAHRTLHPKALASARTDRQWHQDQDQAPRVVGLREALLEAAPAFQASAASLKAANLTEALAAPALLEPLREKVVPAAAAPAAWVPWVAAT